MCLNRLKLFVVYLLGIFCLIEEFHSKMAQMEPILNNKVSNYCAVVAICVAKWDAECIKLNPGLKQMVESYVLDLHESKTIS